MAILCAKFTLLVIVASIAEGRAYPHTDPPGYQSLQGDCSGHNIAQFPGHVANACVPHCEATMGCAGFSHYSRRGCFLKNATCDDPHKSSHLTFFSRLAGPAPFSDSPPGPRSSPLPLPPAPSPSPRPSCPPACAWQPDKKCCGVWDKSTGQCHCPKSIVFSAGGFCNIHCCI